MIRLSWAVTSSHVVAGIFLLVPRTRFLAALLQLPMTIGILAFHVIVWPAGIGVAVVMLLFNLVARADHLRVRALVAVTPCIGL